MDILKKQDAQFELFNKAKSFAANGEIDKGIDILERIMYKDGLLINGVKWPFILADIYYKNSMYDKCWRYLNFLSSKNIGQPQKIRDYQAKISKKEQRPLDALYSKMSCLLHKYTTVEFKPEIEKVEKDLSPFLKKAGMIGRENDFITLYGSYVSISPFNEASFRDDFKKTIGR